MKSGWFKGIVIGLLSVAGLVIAFLALLESPTPVGGELRCLVQKAFYPAYQPGPAPPETVTVQASEQTVPVRDPCDAADDPAIWVDPEEPENSLVLGTNKVRGLNVYRLDGTLVSSLELGRINNVDLRAGVEIGGEKKIVVAASHQDANRIEVLELDPDRGVLIPLAAESIPARAEEETYGICLYRSPRDTALYAFATDKSGAVEQWRLNDVGGTVEGEFVRKLRVGSQPEGCVADDANATLFVGEEDVGVWRFGAEPDDDPAGVLIAGTGFGQVEGARLYADVEGLGIYAPPGRPADEGFLVVSSQGNGTYVLFERAPPHAYRGSFQVRADGRTTGDTDGLEVSAAFLGEAYPRGMLVVQDGINRAHDGGEANQNFKLVSWAGIEDALGIEGEPPAPVQGGQTEMTDSPQVSVRHWSHVIVRVTDMQETLKFWDFLGYEKLSDDLVEGPGLEETVGVPGVRARIVVGLVGGQKLEFVQFDGLPLSDPPGADALGLSGLSIRIDDIDAAYRAARERGLFIEREPTEIHGFRQFFVTDPNGVQVELSQPPEGVELDGPLS